mgnify:CR=1 FL=1
MKGPTTDTRFGELPVGSFILNEGSSKEFPWAKKLASLFSADSEDMKNSQSAILTNGETYFPPDAVKAIGVDTLKYMNNKENGHSAINQIMVKNTLKQLKPMYGGGEVKPIHGYENGGEVGKLSNLLALVTPQGRRQAAYEELVPQSDWQERRGEEDPLFSEMRAINQLTQHDRRKDPSLNPLEKNRADALNLLLYGIVPQASGEQGTVAESLPLDYREVVTDGETTSKVYQEPVSGFYHPEMYHTSDALKDRAIRQIEEGTVQEFKDGGEIAGISENRNGKYYMGQNMLGLLGMQNGGPVEEGIPLPPQPKDPLQINMRQENPSVYAGSVLGMRREASALQDSIEQDTVNKARKTLQLLKLKGLLENSESLDYQDPKKKKGADEEMTRQMLQNMIMMRGMFF